MFGWFWFIPAFHMPGPTSAEGHAQTRLTLGRKEVDFPLGIGKSLVDVEIVLEWHRPQA
jgi:phosphatidylinositol-3,4,5-trisphosphate 3-phosphatase/dual-specificity protein phosphatase PTEN